MIERSTAAWTEIRTRISVAGALLISTGVLVGVERGSSRIALVVLAVATAVAALHFDGFVGVVIGLAAAGGLVAAKRTLGEWSSGDLALVAAEVSTIVMLAWVVGLVGAYLRSALRTLSQPAPGSLVPANSSLGVLEGTPAIFRLDEELQRRSRSGEPLALMLMAVDLAVDDLDDATALSARRAVARHVQTLLRPTDVPFALSDETIGAILPSTDQVDAWALLGPLVDSAGHATFADRSSGDRKVVSDCLDLHVCLVLADERTTDARAFIETARRELDPNAGQKATSA
jgi:GGDEF domain-containing protein